MSETRARAGFTIARTRVALVIAYFVVAGAALMYLHVGLVPDVLVPVLLGAAFVVGRPGLFIRDWGVFLLVLVLWQQTGAVAQWAGFPLHLQELIAADRFLTWPLLHGQLPQEWLQQHLFHDVWVRTQYHPAGWWKGHFYAHAWWGHKRLPPHWQWYDIGSAVLYGLHFPEPLAVGFIIWLRDRALFRRFAAAFLTLAALAFVIYIVYPAVPPWMASYQTFQGKHYAAIAPPLHKIFNDFNDYIQQQAFGHRYVSLLAVKYNLTAAMPSLHAAFPVLSALYLYKACGRWGLLMLVYAAAMWFAVEGTARRWAARARMPVAVTARVASPLLPREGAGGTVEPRRASDRSAR